METRRYGLQKMTLLDYPGKVACTVFTAGCNFRCPFCHNSVLVETAAKDMPLDENELMKFLSQRRGILDGVCITGGEPLLRNDVLDLMLKIKDMGFLIKLDTNGSFPDRLKYVVNEGMVDYVAMDIKSSKERYAAISGADGFLEKICESVDFLKGEPVDFEFRTTVVAGLHVLRDFTAIGEWIRGDERYFLQNFVDSGKILDATREMSAMRTDELKDCLNEVRKYVPRAELRGVVA